ncbi:MAG: Glycine betaine/proline transport system substrate-binding protein, partial [Steroidobacteraceae bacterium]|nr:Glycine betaine/proline transport system substrate-binding protein [Steroidobacteraceae bacterium]
MNQRLKNFAVAAAVAVLAVALASCAKTKEPIKLTLHDWTGQLITTRIMGSVLEKAG